MRIDAPAIRATKSIVAEVRAAFPLDAAVIDRLMKQDYFDVDESPHIWLEHFSQHTTDAIVAADYAVAEAHLKFMSGLLEGADEETIRCIDVTYVESLLWDISDQKIKAKGWGLLPEKIRSLYVEMWGVQPFMSGCQ